MRIGLSTCPNDTFAFAALLEGRVRCEGWDFTLLDIEELNQGLLFGDFDIAKASFALAAELSERYRVLPVGSALGFGVGPLLLARDAERAGREPREGDRVLCPGEHTTANLLYRSFVPSGPVPEQLLFSEIMPLLRAGEADYGVVIHEGRFTYEAKGLFLAKDLGGAWEDEEQLPLPLGGLLARRDLDPGVVSGFEAALRSSLSIAISAPETALPAMRRYAQEFADEVLMEHVRLYVSESTRDLRAEDRRALEALVHKTVELGMAKQGASLF